MYDDVLEDIHIDQNVDPNHVHYIHRWNSAYTYPIPFTAGRSEVHVLKIVGVLGVLSWLRSCPPAHTFRTPAAVCNYYLCDASQKGEEQGFGG